MAHLSARDYAEALALGLQLVELAVRRRPRIAARERRRLERLQPRLERMARLAQRCSEAPETPRAAAATHLTPREVDVMRWLACGKTDADIATMLAISPRTVHKHLEHIYEKLGVETRTAAVMRLQATSSMPGKREARG
ncbi:helix-turn-helix transcriptional regulator [Ramlibacter sp. AN1015]|uniref:helix-turn-helix transcriptional regulator n=1 Tax=Ramlibacter sp. AN1015 TaxID=3133428 RepID=UPI0030C11711